MKKIRILTAVFAIFVIFSASCSNKTKAKDNNSQQDTTTVTQTNTTDNQVVTETNTTTQDNQDNTSTTETNVSTNGDGEVIQLTTQMFKDLVFDYETNQDWVYNGSLPCVIDFYADWCRPCKMVAPIMDELAKEYNGKVIFYKLNVDNEREVASVFGIQSIPSVLFVPVNDKPQMSVGAMQKEGYVNAIQQVLGVQ